MFFAVILDTFSEIRNKQVITLFSYNNQVFDAKANFVISLPFAVNAVSFGVRLIIKLWSTSEFGTGCLDTFIISRATLGSSDC